MRALLALLLLAAQPAPGGAVIDHLILGIGDLDRGIAAFAGFSDWVRRTA